MTNRPKQIGTAAETHVVKSLHTRAVPAQRVALHGTQDMGDVWALPLQTGGARVVFEVKAGQQTRNPSWRQVDEWFAEAMVAGDRPAACKSRQ